MSGICGIVNFDGEPVDPGLLAKMAKASEFRGPDGIQYWVKDNVGLAHLALHSTPESVREELPMVSCRGDLVLTADARVDNRPELIDILLSKGTLHDNDPTDADLILAAYECWGEDCPEYIIGDFAFAIWDVKLKRLFCTRDPAGARLICYHYNDRTLRFGSDPRQIIADPEINRDLDGYYFTDIFTLDFDHARTVYSKVQMVVPGHSLLFPEDRKPSGWRYWNPEKAPKIYYRSDREYVDHFRALLFRCVADRLRSLKPTVAIQVSGGLDSSSIAAIAHRLYTEGATEVKPIGYTAVYNENKAYDEREYSLAFATENSIKINQIPGEDYLFLDPKINVSPEVDNPLMDNEGLSCRFMRDAQSDGCGHFLTGFGGDTIFMASKRLYHDHVRALNWAGLKPWILSARDEGISWPRLIATYILWPLFPRRLRILIDRYRKRQRAHHLPPWIHPFIREHARYRQRMRSNRYSVQYPSSVRQLQYEHLLGMRETPMISHSLNGNRFGMEMGYPLLDRRVAEFILASPLNLGTRPGSGNTKWLLRQALKGVLPEKIRCRTGKGDALSYHVKILTQHLKSRVKELSKDSVLDRRNLINSRRFIDDYQSFCRKGESQIPPFMFYLPLSLEMWMRSFGQSVNIVFPNIFSWQTE